MTAKSDFEVSSGSVWKVKSMDGTRTVASSCAAALKPSKRYCRVGSSYLTGSSVALKDSLKSRNAGVVSASIAEIGCFELRRCLETFEAILPSRIFIFDRVVSRFKG